MTDTIPESRQRRRLISLWAHYARLTTGIVLFAFATTHLLNHAVGLISIDAMETVQGIRTAVTRSIPGTVILLLSAVIHIILGCVKFLRRRTWRLRFVEFLQLSFGLMIPLLLFRHIIGTRIASELVGFSDDYTYALFVMWPNEAWRQALLIMLVWIHGCIGLRMWLHLKSWYKRWQPLLLGIGVLIPVLGFAGFSVAGRNVAVERTWENPFSQEQFLTLKAMMEYALWGYAALLLAMVLVRLVMGWSGRFLPRVNVKYDGGPSVSVPPGRTLLEVSRSFNIPHASVCGGRARCSTCRVRVLEGLEHQPEPSDLERRVLERVGATGNVRLACQFQPKGNLSVVPLLPAHRFGPGDLSRLDKYFWGVEQKVTLLFADIRGFTSLSEKQLPFDVVFLLNQYLGRMSEAITDAGGYVDKFMGDGIMAIFGMDVSPEQGAREALAAARAMSGVLDALNQSLAGEVAEPLRIGIGIHTGDAILGRIGVASGTGAGERITALGDTVNTASRLESACKDLKVQLVVSATTLQLAGHELPESGRSEIEVRGRSEALEVLALSRATKLPGSQPATA